jgi:hypothetical protein
VGESKANIGAGIYGNVVVQRKIKKEREKYIRTNLKKGH